MPVPVTNPNFFAIDPATGLPLMGGLLWSYDATTGVLAPLFANAGLTAYQTNPIILDASGCALAYADFKFKLVLEYPPQPGNTHGAQIREWDNLEQVPLMSYLNLGSTVPATPPVDELALYCSGTHLLVKNSDGVVTSPATSADIQQQSFSAASGGGTGDAITASFTPPMTALIDKTRVWVWAPAINTTATPTFSPDSLTPTIIVKGANHALAPGDIPGANALILLEYNGTLARWVLANPFILPQAYALLQNRQAQNTAGGTATSGSWLIVPINTEQEDTNSIVDSTSLPAFSLAPGIYKIEAVCPLYACNSGQIRLYNVTDSAVSLIGGSVFAVGTGYTMSHLKGTITITGTKQFRLEYQVQNTCATTGLGYPANFGDEVYAQLSITQIG